MASYKRASSILESELKNNDLELSNTTDPGIFKNDYEKNLLKKINELRKYFTNINKDENYIESLTNLAEAKNYINSKEVFVSESIMISSANDNKTIIIEKTPKKTDLFEDNELIICSNHFQSSTFLNDSINIKNIKNTDSKHRYNRVNELIKSNSILDVKYE